MREPDPNRAPTDRNPIIFGPADASDRRELQRVADVVDTITSSGTDLTLTGGTGSGGNASAQVAAALSYNATTRVVTVRLDTGTQAQFPNYTNMVPEYGDDVFVVYAADGAGVVGVRKGSGAAGLSEALPVAAGFPLTLWRYWMPVVRDSANTLGFGAGTMVGWHEYELYGQNIRVIPPNGESFTTLGFDESYSNLNGAAAPSSLVFLGGRLVTPRGYWDTDTNTRVTHTGTPSTNTRVYGNPRVERLFRTVTPTSGSTRIEYVNAAMNVVSVATFSNSNTLTLWQGERGAYLWNTQSLRYVTNTSSPTMVSFPSGVSPLSSSSAAIAPDGALWTFTTTNMRRIATNGLVTNYNAPWADTGFIVANDATSQINAAFASADVFYVGGSVPLSTFTGVPTDTLRVAALVQCTTSTAVLAWTGEQYAAVATSGSFANGVTVQGGVVRWHARLANTGTSGGWSPSTYYTYEGTVGG
jgi:hypothetical protein